MRNDIIAHARLMVIRVSQAAAKPLRDTWTAGDRDDDERTITR